MRFMRWPDQRHRRLAGRMTNVVNRWVPPTAAGSA
jgi:hypothetical protein